MRNARGFTLVELIVAMLVISLIGVVGGSAFLQVLRVSNETHERGMVFENGHSTIEELGRISANMIPEKICGMGPYSKGIDQDTGAPTYRFLTRLGESSFRRDVLPEAQVMLVEIKVLADEEGDITLALTKTPISLSGKMGDTLEGILATGLKRFDLVPVYETAQNGAEIPVEFKIEQEYILPYDEIWRIVRQVPVYARPRKQQE